MQEGTHQARDESDLSRPQELTPMETEVKTINKEIEEPLLDNKPKKKLLQAYSVVFEIEEDLDLESKQYTTKDILKYALIIVGVGIVLYAFFAFLGGDFLKYLIKTLQNLIKEGGISSLIAMALFQFVFGWVLFFPMLSTFNILQAYLMRSFFLSCLVSFIGAYLASLSIFLIIKNFFRQRIIDKFRKKILFRIVYVEVKKNPWYIGIAFNFLFVPASVKNYLLALTSITFPQYSVCVIPGHLFYCVLCAFVGYSMTDLDSLIHGVPWSQKTTAEKIEKILTYFLLLGTLALFGYFIYYARQKYKEIEEEYRQEALEAQSNMMEKEMHGLNNEPDSQE